jgi:hypothetical protein
MGAWNQSSFVSGNNFNAFANISCLQIFLSAVSAVEVLRGFLCLLRNPKVCSINMRLARELSIYPGSHKLGPPVRAVVHCSLILTSELTLRAP